MDVRSLSTLRSLVPAGSSLRRILLVMSPRANTFHLDVGITIDEETRARFAMALFDLALLVRNTRVRRNSTMFGDPFPFEDGSLRVCLMFVTKTTYLIDVIHDAEKTNTETSMPEDKQDVSPCSLV